MKTLEQHIEDLNAKAQQWMTEEPGRWASEYHTDMDHWAEMGVETPSQFDRYMNECNYWDLYKDMHGIRPRWVKFSELSDAEVETMFQDLCNQLESENAQMAAEEEARLLAEVEHNNIITETLKGGNPLATPLANLL